MFPCFFLFRQDFLETGSYILKVRSSSVYTSSEHTWLFPTVMILFEYMFLVVNNRYRCRNLTFMSSTEYIKPWWRHLVIDITLVYINVRQLYVNSRYASTKKQQKGHLLAQILTFKRTAKITWPQHIFPFLYACVKKKYLSAPCQTKTFHATILSYLYLNAIYPTCILFYYIQWAKECRCFHTFYLTEPWTLIYLYCIFIKKVS